MVVSDSFKVIIIIISFIIIEIIAAIVAIIKQKLEPSCNPILIPFSKLLYKEEPEDVFNTCVTDLTVDFMADFIEPFLVIIKYFSSMGYSFIDIIQNLENSIYGIINNQTSIVSGFNIGIRELLESITNRIKESTREINVVGGTINSFVSSLEEEFDKLEAHLSSLAIADGS